MGEVIMSIPEVLSIIIQFRTAILIPVGLIPVITFIFGFLHGVYDGRKSPWRQIYSLLVAVSSLAMTIFISIIVYLIILGNDPIASTGYLYPTLVFLGWALTALFVNRVVELKYLPGLPGLFLFILELFVIWAVGLFIFWSEIWFVLDDPLLSLLGASGIAFIVLHSVLLAATRQNRR